MIIYLSLLIAILGLLTYALSNNVKVGYAGLGAWVAGLTAFLVNFHQHLVKLFP